MKLLTRYSFVFAILISGVQVAALNSAFALEQTVTSIANFAVVDSGVYRGARPETAKAMRDLKDLGVKTVIDLQGGDIGNSSFGWIAGMLEPGEHPSWIAYEKQTVESLGMKFLNVPINSLNSVNEKQGFGLGRAVALMKDPKNLPVYVHCEHGIDRTGLLIALYRVYHQNWTRQAAYDEMVEMGHGYFRQFVTGDMDTFFWAATEGLR